MMTGMPPARRLLRRLAPVGAPVALIALPILGAGLLAWSAAEAERAAAAARRMSAAGLRLAAVAEKLETRAQTVAAQAVAMAAAARSLEDLHSLVARNDLILAAVYRGEQRLFPPEDSAGLTAAEARALAALSPALTATRRRLTPDGAAWGRGAAPGGAVLLACRRDGPTAVDYCAAMAESALRDSAAAELQGAAAKSGWRFALIDPDGGAAETNAETAQPAAVKPAGESVLLAEQALSGPLHGWRLQAFGGTASRAGWPGDGGAGFLYLLIGLPSAALWAAGAWRFHQSRQAGLTAQLAEGRRRAELAARLSHDLRTPLANLRLYADLIRRRADDPPTVADYAAVLELEIDRLDAIAGAAVAAATGENTVETLRPALIDPVAKAAELALRCAPGLKAAGCAFSLSRDDDDGRRGVFDAAALARIWSNLLDNAGKFAAGRPVEALVRHRDGLLTLAVRDHGPGLAGADPARRGAGLGLAAAARLAALHGGDLRLEDAQPGLRVVVRLRTLIEPEGEEGRPCAC